MIGKLKTLPKNVSLIIGIALILISGFFPFDSWTGMLIRGTILFVAILFILAAAEKNKEKQNEK